MNPWLLYAALQMRWHWPVGCIPGAQQHLHWTATVPREVRMQQGPPQFSASLQALQQYTQFKISWILLLSWTVTESRHRHIPVFCCWGNWMLITGQHFLLLFSLFENNNSCWGALASGRLWLHVIHVAYVCSEHSERADKSLTWSSCPLLLQVSRGPIALPQELQHGRCGSSSLAEYRFVSCQVCVLSPLVRTSSESLPKEHFRISKINVQGANLACFWVKQNEKSPRFTRVYLSKLIKQSW